MMDNRGVVAMTATMIAQPEIHNLAELLTRLGGVALDRIRVQPPLGTATVEDVVEIEARENRLFELVDGILVEKVMGFTGSRIASRLIAALEAYADAHDLGVVTGEGGMIRMPDNLVRIPDVSFIGWDQFPDRELPEEGAPEIVPDLAVEVLSKGNTAAEMARKLREYFVVGATLVWFVEPRDKTVTVYSSPSKSKVLSTSDMLDGGKVLPGFKLPVAKLFTNLGRSSKKRK
jgi:Uma2 family endonuclease